MKKSILIAIIAVLLLLLVNQCNSNKNATQANTIGNTDSINYYKNRLGTQTATIRTLQLEKDQLYDLVLSKDAELTELAKEFKKVKSIVKVETVTEIPTVKDSFTVPIPCPDFERKGNVQNKHYSFQYKITPEALTLDSLRIPNNITIITGTKRKWLLGKQYITTDVTNSNPYVTVTDIKAVDVIVPEPWYKKWYVWGAAGFIAGVSISN